MNRIRVFSLAGAALLLVAAVFLWASATIADSNRRTLRADSFIPAIMGVIYFCLFLYFKAQGGYKAVHITAPATEPA